MNNTYARYSLFSDVDGTQAGSDGSISPENLAALDRFMEGGGLFGISTGRTLCNMGCVLTGVRTNMVSIMANGGALGHLDTGSYEWVTGLERERLQGELSRLMEEHPSLAMVICTDGPLYLCHPTGHVDPLMVAEKTAFLSVPPSDLPRRPWIKVMFNGPNEELAGVRNRLRAAFAGMPVQLLFSLPTYLELLPEGNSKGKALEVLRGRGALAGRKVIAAGDYYNDYEILLAADVGVCPSNAPEDLRRVAGFTGRSNDESLIAQIVEELIPALEHNNTKQDR